MMNTPQLVIDFYHDVVCGWCFVLSPRLRRLVRELPVTIRHRSFVLQASRAEMVEAFGSMERAKSQILGHWNRCAEADDVKGRIDVDGMRRRAFEYPSGLAAALACKAAEAQGGQDAHWDLFDALQRAHLTETMNVADQDVLMQTARGIGLDMRRFEADLDSPSIRTAVEMDRYRAALLGIRSIPSLVIEEARVLLGNAPEAELRAQILAVLDLMREDGRA